MKYRIEVQISHNKLTRVWRSFYGSGVSFPRNKAITRAAQIQRSLEAGCGRIRIRPAS